MREDNNTARNYILTVLHSKAERLIVESWTDSNIIISVYYIISNLI